MAQYADNDWYLDIDGTDISSYVTEISLDPTTATNDTTAGSSTDHMSRSVGLQDHSLSFTVYADDSAGYSLALLKGTHTVTYGQQGNAAGKPKHVQSFILTSASHTTTVDKAMVVYAVSGEAAAAPTTDMFNAGVWS